MRLTTPNYVYPVEYRIRPVTEQADILRQFFPGIGFANKQLAESPIVSPAEGCFMAPPWWEVASTYGEAVETVFKKISSQRSFRNHRKGWLGSNCLRESGYRSRMFHALVEQQRGFNLLVFQAQFGIRRCGYLADRVLSMFMKAEFGLGVFTSGIMLLTHPERLTKPEDLPIGCIGDEYNMSGRAHGKWNDTPIWCFGNDGLEFSTYAPGYLDVYCGSASAFLPTPS